MDEVSYNDYSIPNNREKNETTACHARENIFPPEAAEAVWVTSTGFSSVGALVGVTEAEAIALGFEGATCFLTVGTLGGVEVPTARSAETDEVLSGEI